MAKGKKNKKGKKDKKSKKKLLTAKKKSAKKSSKKSAKKSVKKARKSAKKSANKAAAPKKSAKKASAKKTSAKKAPCEEKEGRCGCQASSSDPNLRRRRSRLPSPKQSWATPAPAAQALHRHGSIRRARRLPATRATSPARPDSSSHLKKPQCLPLRPFCLTRLSEACPTGLDPESRDVRLLIWSEAQAGGGRLSDIRKPDSR